MNKLFSYIFGLLLLLYVAEEVITSFDLIKVPESVENEMETDESDSDEKEEEFQFAKFFIENEFDLNLRRETFLDQNKVKPIISIGKPLTSISNPPYCPPDIN